MTLKSRKHSLLLCILVTWLLFVSAPGTSYAVSINPTVVAEFSIDPDFDETAIKSANESFIEDAVERALGNMELKFYAKIDAPAETSDGLSLGYGGNPADSTSGSWSTVDPILYYVIKASTQAILWQVGNGGGSSGSWTTAPISNNKGKLQGLSYFMAFRSHSQPVPEPATLMLLGFGLLGLATIGRRKIKR